MAFSIVFAIFVKDPTYERKAHYYLGWDRTSQRNATKFIRKTNVTNAHARANEFVGKDDSKCFAITARFNNKLLSKIRKSYV